MWHYLDLPESMRMPPCPHCRNRALVARVMPGVYFCGDCGRSFAAEWREERHVSLTAPQERVR